MKQGKKRYKKNLFIMFLFHVFIIMYLKNALLDMGYFLIFSHIIYYIIIYIYIYIYIIILYIIIYM